MKKNALLVVALGIVLSACGQRQSDSAKYTAPPGYDSTVGTCNPNYNYPPSSPCYGNPPPATTGMKLTVDTTGCAATIAYAKNSRTTSITSSSFSQTFSAVSGDTFSLVAQSTCGAGGAATVRMFKNGTQIRSDSKVGPNVATVSATY